MPLLLRSSLPTPAVVVLLCGLLLSGCNDLPTDVGSDLVPGTDTLYLQSSTSTLLMTDAGTRSEREPFYNSTYMLFGKTSDSEARMFVELVNYPDLGAPDSFTVISSELLLQPEAYIFGDTNDRLVDLRILELQQEWSAQATWDSIWAPDGSSTYYSDAQTPLATFSATIDTANTTLAVPIDLAATKRWLDLASDSATSGQVFGMVLLPRNTASIRQFRNLNDTRQAIQLRVVWKHADSTEPDTTLISSVAASFVNTPIPQETELVTQGAHQHFASFRVQVDSLDEFAILLGARLHLKADLSRSQIGRFGIDEVLGVRFRSSGGEELTMVTRGTADGEYTFDNIVPILQRLRADGGTGTIWIVPVDNYALWRMNRLWFHPTTASDPNVQATLSIVYTIPTVLQ